jgi:hypothetical protein
MNCFIHAEGRIELKLQNGLGSRYCTTESLGAPSFGLCEAVLGSYLMSGFILGYQ